MKKNTLFVTLLPLFLLLSACNPTPADSTPVGTSTDVQVIAETEAITVVPSASPTPSSLAQLTTSDGPFLLIQTDAQAFEIIDFALGEHYPLILPVEGRKVGISGSLSPSKTILKLPFEADQVRLFNILTGAIQTIDLPDDGFDADQTAELAQTAFESMGLSYEAALDAVQVSYTNSISNVQWYQDDDHLLAVITGSPTSTQLALVDAAANQVEPLESLPGLVESFTRSGEWVLLKKGYINEPGYALDDQYYVLNLNTLAAESLELPEDVDNPIIAWFGGSTLSIIHESQPIGGINFTTLDVNGMNTQLIIAGQFSSVQSFQDGLLVFR
ncbi:MAG: hypothetical protein H0S82_08165, partial [Anaerolineaceae bacterium]|nr:hypothetical protein [Anaerolineaceae bacterium]